jgi:tetratricopeptide (TPR) repeat protein
LYRADELEASIAEFRKALALTPRHPVLLVDLGDAVSDLGWRAQDARILQESLVHLSHALQLYPDYGRAAEEFDMATERHGVLAAPRRRKARGEGSSAPRPARTDQSLGDWVADELEADAAAWRKREAERLAAKGKRYWNLCVCEGCGIRYVLGVNSVVTTGDGVVILFQTDTHVLLGVISSTTPDRIALKAGHPSWPEWAAPPEPDGETPALVGLAQSRQRIRRWTCEKCGATHDYPWS